MDVCIIALFVFPFFVGAHVQKGSGTPGGHTTNCAALSTLVYKSAVQQAVQNNGVPRVFFAQLPLQRHAKGSGLYTYSWGSCNEGHAPELQYQAKPTGVSLAGWLPGWLSDWLPT